MSCITTTRLELRRFAESDTQAYTEIITNPDVTRYLGSGRDCSKEDALKFLARYESVWDEGYGIFAVTEQASSNLIGYCGIRKIPDGRVELLYAYAPLAWGKGYATEAGKAVLAYAREHFELSKVIAMSYPQNAGSIGVIKKLGFKSIGQEEHFGKMLEVFALDI